MHGLETIKEMNARAKREAMPGAAYRLLAHIATVQNRGEFDNIQRAAQEFFPAHGENVRDYLR